MSVEIRPATAEDAALVADLLGRLAGDLGDGAAFSTTPEILLRQGLGKTPLFHALIGWDGEEAVGLVFYFPHFSTLRGMAGVYVQDLWAAPGQRGSGLGPRLMAAAMRHGQAEWNARYLMLSVHENNEGARRFYDRLGFETHDDATMRALIGPPLARLLHRAEP